MIVMNKIKILPLLLVLPICAFGAGRGDSGARVGVNRVSQAASRMPAVAASVKSKGVKSVDVVESKTDNVVSEVTSSVSTVAYDEDDTEDLVDDTPVVTSKTEESSGDCREAYRQCMDEFCLLEESQGERCDCSDNINSAKSKIKAVLTLQEEADKLFTEGVEREQLGAKARLVFTDNNTSTKVSSSSFMSWLAGGEEDEEEDVGEDVMIGDELYEMAEKYCQSELKACGSKAEMESMLYSRMITQDCKSYDAYLKEQKANAESNKRIAESAVRKARLEMLDTTNKYNRGAK